jgi:5-methylcytosine-specific restriction endonuclease McrBC GTP-binding regulatory subunit McrB
MENIENVWNPNIIESKKLYESFLNEFPLVRLNNLTIEEYTNLNKSDSFCYWVETKLRKLGSIQGSTSYKFGIYEFNKKPREDSGYSHDEKYAWCSKYGSDSKSAYESILSNLVKIAECAQVGDFEAVDSIDMSNMFKWKIAFLYSDYKLLNVFSEDGIRYLSKKFGMENTEKATFSQMYKYLLEQKGDEEGILEYSAKIWNEWLEYKGEESGNVKYWSGGIIWSGLNKLEDFSEDNCWRIGWDKTSDTKGAKQAWQNIKEINIGDFLAFHGYGGQNDLKIYQISRVVGKDIEFGTIDFEKLNRDDDILYHGKAPKMSRGGWFGTLFQVEGEEAINAIFGNYVNGNLKMKVNQSNLVVDTKRLLEKTKNLILTGAPGTGKTYLAKEIAAAMGCTENEIGFVQFHPSYDYTDFVEGLRPVSKDNCDNIGFERKDGVFKEFCKRALDVKPQNKKQLPLTSANGISFNDVYDSLLNDVKRGAITTYDRKSKPGKLSYDGSRIRYENDKTESEDNMKLMYDYYVENQIWDLSEYKKGDFEKLITQLTEGETNTLDYVEYGWTLQQLLNRAKEFLNKGNKEIVVDDPIASDEVEINEETKPFVFIIDEINRGEISKIFGELFFSIDPGYRGEKGRVKTQYQNLVEEGDMFSDGFFVPENVYIIGTMNDIDRSVESMDFAFRRRFAFAEVKAEDNVKMLDELEVLDLKDDAINRMNRLNSAISKIEGLSSAYHIGASYFLKLKEYGDDCWEALWNYHLEGLLREYLRGMPNADEEMRKLENAYWGNESDSDN